MKIDTPVVIERVANGYQVRPMYGSGECVCVQDLMVFQDMGYASAARDYQDTKDTLLGFISEHFSDPKKSANAMFRRPPDTEPEQQDEP